MLGSVCAAFGACTARVTPPPESPQERGAHDQPSQLSPPVQACVEYIALDDLQPTHELHSPMACGNYWTEHFEVEIGPDGHVISVEDGALQYPNWRARKEIKSWLFKPTLHDGIPIAVCTSVGNRPPTFERKAEICPAS
jgi:hypothetical protein